MDRKHLQERIEEHLDLFGDRWVWIIFIVLCSISFIEVFSASSRDTFTGKAFWAPGLQHGLYLLIGSAITLAISNVDCKRFRALCAAGLIASLILFLIMAFGGGVTLNGGTRWIRIMGFTLQPSEIAKPCLVGTASTFLAAFREKETGEANKNAFIFVAGITLLFVAFIFKENFSTAALIMLVVFLICWYAGAPRKWMKIISFSLIIAGGSFFSFLRFTPTDTINSVVKVTRITRLATWHSRTVGSQDIPEDPNEYNLADYNIQETHSRIAVATGGFIGKGPGNSVQRDYLPMAFSDFIYAIICEEGGFVLGSVVLFLYLFLLYRCFIIAKRCQQRFPAYLVMGLSLMLVIQALVNMSVAVGAMPVTGQPLPLVSKGGTSTMLTCAYFGMILSVSHSAKQVPEEDFMKENSQS